MCLFLATYDQRSGKAFEQGGNMRLNALSEYEDDEIVEQKIWRAVIVNTVREWIRGPRDQKRAAEQFLFRDDQDYRTVCYSAGIDPGNLRERLQRIRERATFKSHVRALQN
jgi:hypothetical protein